MKAKPVILVVDDLHQNIELLEAYLAGQCYEIVTASSGEEALGKISGNQIDLILLDVMMPGIDGFEVTRRVRQDGTQRLLPIILVTSLNEREDRIKGIEAGCDDFISKPVDKMELLARVRSSLKVKAYNDLLRNYREELESEVTGRTEELKHAMESLQQDITERKRAEDALRESETQYRFLFDSVPLSIAITTLDGRALIANRGFEELNGYTKEEFIALKDISEMYADCRQRKPVISLLQKAGKLRDFEVKLKRKDGTVYDALMNVDFIKMGSEQVIFSSVRDITERKRAVEELRQNEEKYRTILENIQEGYFDVDLAGNFTFFNDSMCLILGYSKEELMGMNYRQYTDKETAKILFQAFNKVYNTGEPSEGFDWQIIRKDGAKRYVEASVSLQKNSSGKPTGFRGIVRDITERKLAEDALRESETQYRFLMENIKDVVWTMDAETMRFLYVSPSVVRLRGYTPEEIIATPLDLALTAEDMEYVINITRSRVEDLLSGKVPPDKFYTDEIKQSCKDGSTVWEEVITRYYINQENGRVELHGVARDITDKKRATELFKLQFENSPDLILIIDRDYKIEVINKIMAGNFTMESLKGEDAIAILPQEQRDFVKQTIIRCFETGVIQEIEHSIGDGKWVRSRIVPMHEDGASSKVMIISTDITERKLADEEIIRLNVELEQKVADRTRELQDTQLALLNLVDDLNQNAKNTDVINRRLEETNKELGSFSYSVSHDLRAPLRSIDGFSLALLEDYQEKLDDTGRNYLNRIRAATQHMDLLIEDMLKLSRISNVEFHHESIDLSKIVQSIAETFQQSNPDYDIKMIIQRGIVIKGDFNSMEIALTNLLENAWKFTGKQKNPSIEFGMTFTEGKKVFFIRDNGVGFDMAYVDKLFGAFQRLHSTDEFPGTGIGLATVKRIITRHGGQIWAEGEVGKGATFFFTLPE